MSVAFQEPLLLDEALWEPTARSFLNISEERFRGRPLEVS